MINVVYLVLVIIYRGDIEIKEIPQANMAQCQVNAKNYNGFEYAKDEVGAKAKGKAYCIVGVK